MKWVHPVYLLLGANLGNREENLQLAHRELQGPDLEITRQSGVYQTAPWGDPNQPAFLNQVLELRTSFSPDSLLRRCQQIEALAGPPKSTKWGARYLDIDILFYDEEVIEHPNLKVPHPELHRRKFTLVPLAEIAPDFIHPTLHQSIRALLNQLSDPLEVKPYPIHAS